MRFLNTDEQQAFAEAVDELVINQGGAAIAQAWATGDPAKGIELWRRFAELGLGGLRISEDEGGLGGSASDLVVIFERLGYHAVPGPYLESIAFLPQLVDEATRQELAAGTAVATATLHPHVPAALDAAVSTHRYVIADGRIATASLGAALKSMAPSRTLALLEPAAEGTDLDPAVLDRAFDEATLANAALLVGAGERLLDEAVSYAKIREQFGRAVGEYQALKHALANVRIALSFARPLIESAALDLDSTTRARDVSAAKVAAASAATLAARTSLQVHGAIGYTAEHHLGLWVTLVPALVQSWGTPAFHRGRIARSILAS